MLNHVKGSVVFNCDGCSDFIVASSFDEGREEMKSQGWRTYRPGNGFKGEKSDDWQHRCSECKCNY